MEDTSDEFLQRKEREWREALHTKLQETNDFVRSQDMEIKELTDNLAVLERDFRYNLTLLADRDAELDKFEAMVNSLRGKIDERTHQISQLRMQLEDAKLSARRQYLESDDARRRFEQALNEKDAFAAEIKSKMEEASKKYKHKFVAECEEHRRHVLNINSDVERRLAEIQATHTSAICLKDTEHQKATDELRLRTQKCDHMESLLHEHKLHSESLVTKLRSQISSLELQQTDREAIYKKLTDDYHTSLQGHETLLSVATSKLSTAEAKLREQQEEIKILRLKDGVVLKEKSTETDLFIIEPDKENVCTLRREDEATIVNNETEIKQLKQQNYLLREVIKDMRRKLKEQEQRERCVEIDEKEEINNEIKEETENEDDKRIQKLENTISLLKKQMLNDIRMKLSNECSEMISFGDVRIMLLEQKLDKATESIGKVVAEEKKQLLEEMYQVRTELVTKLNETNLRDGESDRLMSEKMMEKVRDEIVRLERKLDEIGRIGDDDGGGGGVVTCQQNNSAQGGGCGGGREGGSWSNLRPTVLPIVLHEHEGQVGKMTVPLRQRLVKTRVRNYSVQDNE